MKHFIALNVIVLFVMLFSCNNKKNTANNAVYTSHLKPGKYCYAAYFEKDSANLMLDIAATGKIKGQLTINYYNADTVTTARQPTTGEVTGEFRGDTLMADYNFTSGPKGKTKYANPIALLHKGDTLIMGKGIIYEYLGRTYFDPQTPINYKKSKFKFVPVECKK